MIVTFVSQCQKKSLDITRQVLDAYANRIGERTWQTVITQEGLNAVRSRLAKTARKTTAVSCHRMRGTSRTELVWIVGNRRQFDEFGNVPVNRTQRDLHKEDWEDDWRFLPLLKVLIALAALFHDFGKSWDHFQGMLKNPDNKKKRDPIRHEWISLLLFKALVNGKTDQEWLADTLTLKAMNPKARQAFMKKLLADALPSKADADYPFETGFAQSRLATWVAWLIVTHHKLPRFQWDKSEAIPFSNGNKPVKRQALLECISREMGYIKDFAWVFAEKKDWKFANGLPLLSDPWCKEAARWAGKAQAVLSLLDEAEAVERLLLTLARLALMLGDHHYSSQDKDPQWRSDMQLYANTGKDKEGNRPLKQQLDEHLVKVADAALKIGHLLPAFEKELPRARDVRALRKPSPPAFAWQNKAVQVLATWRKAHALAENGFFAVNMASTGCGKTFANAKVMAALHDDNSLRYNLALGLRTLTLQTGDEYRDKLKLDNTELAVLIGSAAVRFLHEQRQDGQTVGSEDEAETSGSASARSLSEGMEIVYESAVPDERLSTVLRDTKSKSLLYAPVVVSTIDHLMPATEGVNGGKHILPTLRLMSADLVIDEVDDFDQQDLPAIARLVHLSGMLGRKVMISSATIPPAIAEGLFHAYQQGWKLFAASRQRKAGVTAFWLDEFGNNVQRVTDEEGFRSAHQAFVGKRLKALARETQVRRKARVLPLSREGVQTEDLQQYWFQQVLNSAISLHRQYGVADQTTGKRLSVGVVRVANVDPCINLSRYLLGCDLPEDVEIRVMPYHSRQVLLLRSEQEKHLDSVLNRKQNRQPQDNLLIKRHLQHCTKPNLIFILVATPVEEVGRDHDLDWAVIEPSSLRSIIQMAGRVMRHRVVSGLVGANLLLMEYNLKGFVGQQKVVFQQPGYESSRYPLATHRLTDLLDTQALAERVDAAPRIQCADTLQPTTSLSDLEHQVLQEIMTKADFTPRTVQGWTQGAFYLTSLAQQVTRFRDSEQDEAYKLHIEEGALVLRQPIKEGVQGKQAHNLHIETLEPELRGRLWLTLDYPALIEEQRRTLGYSTRRTCEFLGEIRLPDKEGEQHFVFIPELGFQRQRKGA
ncbi:type I-F CRISPR-associated helicase Cas3f [Thiothrix subterranea]|uniref:Type I-F CRISPR-associated helicase Cas3f n=2 Tax=Thiothrix subterranea TaxID=2735563 RepID=A0AA51R0A9_9GAMM|nr:type I-F CRISPR-associated helicase Cas3f [Thiothrix subterranea]WML85494.1 type I-F CRISPR-associated helicase Cas3f [Thiothrix subterranea]